MTRVLNTLNYVCIHGHFYQPSRENPFTGLIDEPSAAPYGSWNERITEECYRPNTAATILGSNGKVQRRINTYEWMSFDFGPTLLDWLERNEPETYRAILDADRRSQRRFSGHGSAMAQAYNHTILPLSNRRDKRTQVRWGIADFEHRFGREPVGMWLPETAVDLDILGMLADEGIGFTVLSPYQAASVRDPEGEWSDVYGGRIDTRIPYRVELADGKAISVFFYDGPLSEEIAFDSVLDDGRILAKRLTQALREPSASAVLAHVATDGETYGHHHPHGEMALARAIADLDADPDITITNYAWFLSNNPPAQVVRIIENSSWSCPHGVERWKADCGCHTGTHPDWSQGWRRPLRRSLDFLRDRCVGQFETLGAQLLNDPWMAREAYIDVMLNGEAGEFLDEHCRPELDLQERDRALGLLEIQRHAMLMYTSCGWFFEDVSGLETVVVLRHAGKLIALVREVLGIDLEPEFLTLLAEARSNVDSKTGRDVFCSEVGPYLGSVPL